MTARHAAALGNDEHRRDHSAGAMLFVAVRADCATPQDGRGASDWRWR